MVLQRQHAHAEMGVPSDRLSTMSWWVSDLDWVFRKYSKSCCPGICWSINIDSTFKGDRFENVCIWTRSPHAHTHRLVHYWTVLVEMELPPLLCPLSGLCWVCQCWWLQSCSEIADRKDVWWEVCRGYILPTECLQEGISISDVALIRNLRTTSCFWNSSISWVILLHSWMQ